MKLNCYYFQSCFGFLSDHVMEADFMKPFVRLFQFMNAQGLVHLPPAKGALVWTLLSLHSLEAYVLSFFSGGQKILMSKVLLI